MQGTQNRELLSIDYGMREKAEVFYGDEKLKKLVYADEWNVRYGACGGLASRIIDMDFNL